MKSDTVGALGGSAQSSRLIMILLAVGLAALLATAAVAFWVQRQNAADADW